MGGEGAVHKLGYHTSKITQEISEKRFRIVLHSPSKERKVFTRKYIEQTPGAGFWVDDIAFNCCAAKQITTQECHGAVSSGKEKWETLCSLSPW